jgi:WD40 repeat protein
VQRRSDLDTEIELWSLSDAERSAMLRVAGTPALVSLDATGSRIAIADFDRAVRIWDFQSSELIAQIDLAAQPSELSLATGGQVLGVVFGDEGAALWRVDQPGRPIYEEFSRGRWQLAFSSSGTKALIGRPDHGFQVYQTADGRLQGPALGSGGDPNSKSLLAFSADEQSIVTGGPDSTARFWRTPAQSAGDVNSGAFLHIWPPSGDAVAIATPDAATIVVGDHDGDVHMLSAAGGRAAIVEKSVDVSYIGHSRKVRLLTVSADSSRVASAADDNSLRVWNTATGLPQPFFGDIEGNPVERMVFSPDASMLGVLSSDRIHILESDSGVLLASFELGGPHRSMAFSDAGHLYLGSDSGTLRVVARDLRGDWSMQSLWQGDAAIRWLEASPQARLLVFVDQNNLAQQFILSEGRLGESTLQLPGRVQEVAFAPGGSRVLFRTPRWIHRASSSTTGLRWLDAVFVPRSTSSARMVFGDISKNSMAATGTRVYLPIASDGFVELAELNFDHSRGPALFGNKEMLLAEWQHRFGLDQAAPN